MTQRFPSERQTHQDRHTGATITQWTKSPARDNHLYFTTPSVTVDDRWLVLQSERLGPVNLFAIERPTGEIHQLSNNPHGTKRSYCWPVGTPYGIPKCSPVLDATHNRLFYFQNDDLSFVQLDDLPNHAKPQKVWTAPAGWWHGFNHICPDGKSFCVPLLDPRAFPDNLLNQRQQLNLGPKIIDALGLKCLIYMIDIETGQADIAAELPFWVTHVQFDPMGSGRVIFNMEGDRIYHHSRTWCLETDGSWRPLYDEPPNEWDNHENWSADGTLIVYHGARDGTSLIAARDWSGKLAFEWLFPDERIGHTTPTLDASGFITDGGDAIAVFSPDHSSPKDKPQRLEICKHDAHQVLNQDDHVHPLITPNGNSIIYASNITGTSNVYEVAMPNGHIR